MLSVSYIFLERKGYIKGVHVLMFAFYRYKHWLQFYSCTIEDHLNKYCGPILNQWVSGKLKLSELRNRFLEELTHVYFMFGIRLWLAWNHNNKTCSCLKHSFKFLILSILNRSYLDLVKIPPLHQLQKCNINHLCFLKTCNVCTTMTATKRFISSQSHLHDTSPWSWIGITQSKHKN